MALDFVAGCLGGCAGVAVGHPFDTIKVRMQTQDFRNPKYRGAFHCFNSILKNESIRGLFKGMSSPMAGVAVVNAIIFGVQGNVSRHMKDPDALRSHVIAGSSAGLVQAFVTSPMELLKTRLQLQESSALTSPIECARRIFQTEGLKGLFRGQMITVMRDVPAFGTYFLTYESLSRLYVGDDGLPSAPAVLMAGGMAGVASWMITYPIDVVKTRLQCDGIGGINKYKGILDCVKVGIAEEGLSSLTRGLAPTLLRAFPVNAATFAVVTWTIRLFPDPEVEESGNTWRDILTLGDELVNAATAPSLDQFRIKHLNPFHVNFNLLPQVMADSDAQADPSERTSSYEHSLRGINEAHTYHGFWAKYDHLISSTRCPFQAIHRHQHNLSNAL
ncbi:mitochondrial basic amino acids transporter-like [Penaeus indicus]|uniref:mitochondrial basic amino acids transporter-like n=1 Tax=Penaeus indicus TaxID=29960 RepID=UPI00300D7349